MAYLTKKDTTTPSTRGIWEFNHFHSWPIQPKKKMVKSTHCLHLWLKVFNGLENFMQACMRLKVNYHRDLKDLIHIGEFGSKHINRKSETLNEFNRSKLYFPLVQLPFFSFFVMSIGSHFSSTNLICGVFQFSQHEGFLFCW